MFSRSLISPRKASAQRRQPVEKTFGEMPRERRRQGGNRFHSCESLQVIRIYGLRSSAVTSLARRRRGIETVLRSSSA